MDDTYLIELRFPGPMPRHTIRTLGSRAELMLLFVAIQATKWNEDVELDLINDEDGRVVGQARYDFKTESWR